MEVRTRVRQLRGERAWLAGEASGQCGLCGDGRACGLRLFGASRPTALEVPSRAACGRPLAPGQLVLVSAPEGAIVRAAAASYLRPLAGLLAAAALARWAGAGETVTFLAAICGTLGAVWYGRRHAGLLRVVAPTAQRAGRPDG